jgi:hypothetical protein
MGNSLCPVMPTIEAAKRPPGCSFGERKYGAPGEIRTPGLLLRRQPLYPAELRAHDQYLQFTWARERASMPSLRGEEGLARRIATQNASQNKAASAAPPRRPRPEEDAGRGSIEFFLAASSNSDRAARRRHPGRRDLHDRVHHRRRHHRRCARFWGGLRSR